MDLTTLGLKKPLVTEGYDLQIVNDNTDKINELITANREQINSLAAYKADLVDGKVPFEQLPTINVPVESVNNKTGAVVLTKSDIGIGNVDNTADSTKNVLSATKLATPRAINGVNFDGTQPITIADGTKAPTNHASTGTTYGVGNASSYGHVKVRNDLVGTETSGATVSPAQIKTLSEKLQKVSTPGRGSVIYTEEVIKGGTLTKNIPIGADCTNATMYFKSNDTSLQEIGIVKITDLNHTYGYAGGYTPAHSDYGAERILPAIENFFGTKGIELKEAYITGTNLRIVFNNVGEYSFNLNCKVLWEAW